ncbi:hypothetical protein [Streptomyces sp. NPDC053048]|uniref:hypothetical protein n=1 Tax=Streptomyces sp. NPDC053048 TaxID=3365694 RepID=UPI0037D93254
MSIPKQQSAPDGEQVVELYGPEDGGWYETRVKDWVGLCADLRDADVRGYVVLRGLVIEKFANHVRKLTLNEMCELIPGPNGKTSSLTRVRDMLRALTAVGLVTTPEGEPLTTSSSKKAADKPLRIRINDAAPKGYQGWRNAEAKLQAIKATAGEADGPRAEEPAPASAAKPSRKAAPKSGRNSDQKKGPGRNSDQAGRDSDHGGRDSDQDSRDDLRERDLPVVSSNGSSLSAEAAGQTASPLPAARGERDQASPTTTVPPQSGARGLEEMAQQVVAAYAAAAAALKLPALPGELDLVRREAGELLAAGAAVEGLAELAAELPAKGWTSLSKHARANRKRAARPTTRAPEKTPVGSPCPKGCDEGWFDSPDGAMACTCLRSRAVAV